MTVFGAELEAKRLEFLRQLAQLIAANYAQFQVARPADLVSEGEGEGDGQKWRINPLQNVLNAPAKALCRHAPTLKPSDVVRSPLPCTARV
jgi:hypothetical protein